MQWSIRTRMNQAGGVATSPRPLLGVAGSRRRQAAVRLASGDLPRPAGRRAQSFLLLRANAHAKTLKNHCVSSKASCFIF